MAKGLLSSEYTARVDDAVCCTGGATVDWTDTLVDLGDSDRVLESDDGGLPVVERVGDLD